MRRTTAVMANMAMMTPVAKRSPSLLPLLCMVVPEFMTRVV